MSEPLIRMTGIRFAYDLGEPVLKDCEFSLRAGERVTLEGANGAGKTSLLLVMLGLLKPSCGEIFAFGRIRRSQQDFREVRTRAGLVFQDPDDQLFCPTVGEDVAFGPRNLGVSAEEARTTALRSLQSLAISDLHDRITYKLSGGEKRLVALAGVLAMRPDVLLLDEPTSALDDTSRERLLGILERLPQAMVVVSHDQDVRARLATRRVRLENGCLRDNHQSD